MKSFRSSKCDYSQAFKNAIFFTAIQMNIGD
jgi:hypothetical protein